MKLQVNGSAVERAEEKLTVDQLVAALQLPAPALLVEHNGTALRREEWPQTSLRDGDVLEIIRIVAGG